MSVYVGIDVHRKRSQVAVIDQGGEVLANRNVPNSTSRCLFGCQSRPRKMPSRYGRRSPRIYPPLVTGSPTTIRRAASSLGASKIAIPVLTWPRHGPAAISTPSASSLRSQAA